MSRTTSALLPSTSELLVRLGERLRVARLRRRLSAKQVAERAGMVPMTLRGVERGGPGVTIGAYLAVLQVLGLEKDLEQLAAADPLGRELQDSRLPVRKPGAGTRSAATHAPTESVGAAASSAQKPAPKAAPLGKREEASPARDAGWVERRGFASSAALASLIEAGGSPAKSARVPSARKRKQQR